MIFSSREIGVSTFQDKGPSVRATRRAGNNRSCVAALLFVCCAFSARTVFAIVPQGSPTSSDLLAQGRNLLRAGRLAEAELVLDRAAELAPSDSVILTLDGRVKGRLGEYANAVALLERVTKLTPQSATSHVDLAIALADSGDLNNALAETGTAISLAPHLAIAHLNRARILGDMKKDREAGHEFAVAVRFAPSNPDSYFYWSIAERTQGNFPKETELLREVVKLQPRNAKAHIGLATSLLDQNRTAEAVSELRVALAIDPNSAQGIYKLSRALYPTSPEESKTLRDHFDRLKAQNTFLDQAKALGNQAFHAFSRQAWRESIRLYTEGIETCGDCEIESALHRDLGLTLYRDDQIERSIEELRKALALDPEDRDAAKALESIRAQNKAE